MRVVLCLDRRNRRPYKFFYDSLVEFYKSHGYEARQVRLINPNLYADVMALNPDVCVIWNGYSSTYSDHVQKLRKTGMKLVFHEIAWFPQSETMYIDSNGMLGDAIKEEIPSNYDKSAWEKQRAEYLNEVSSLYTTSRQALDKRIVCRPNGKLPNDFILVPGQLERDISTRHFSKIHTMQKLVDLVARFLPDEKIVYRAHPVDRDQKLKLPKNVTVINDTPLYETINKAKVVVGINSTVLLESLLLRKPTFAFGDGVWSVHPGTVIKIRPKDLREAIGNYTDNQIADDFIRHLFNIQIRMKDAKFNERNRRTLLND